MVLVLDSRLPPARWQLRRLTQLLPGPDGQVRVVRVKTTDSTLTRPLVKLVRLPDEGAAADTAADNEERQ